MAALVGRSVDFKTPLHSCCWPEGNAIYMCGGAGAKNRLVCAESRQGELSDMVSEFLLGEGCPTKLAITPNKKSIVLAMGQGGIKRLDQDTKGKAPKFIEMSGVLLERLSEIKGEVLSLAFRQGGTHLALGMAEGEVHVYEWPALKPKLGISGDRKLAGAVVDIDFGPGSSSGSNSSGAGGKLADAVDAASSSGRSCVSVVLDNGSCEVWDWDQGLLLSRMEPGPASQQLERAIVIKGGGKTRAQGLPRGIDKVAVARARFALDGSGDLLTLLSCNNGAYLARWSGAAQMPALVSCKKVSERACTCFDVSRNGVMLAFGTAEGAVVVTSAANCTLLKRLDKAHTAATSAVTFSPSCKHVLSVSTDASARVTSVNIGEVARVAVAERKGLPQWIRVLQLSFILFAIFLTIALQAVRVLKQRGMSTEEIKAMLRRWVGLSEAVDEL